MKLIPYDFREEIDLHIDSIKKRMPDRDDCAVLLNANSNIYYSSGRFFRGYVFIPKIGNPLWFVVKPTDFEHSSDLLFIRKPEQIPDCLKSINRPLPSCVGLEYDDLSYSDVKRLMALFPSSEFFNASQVLKSARMIKTNWELNQMKIDGTHQCRAYSKIRDCFRPGMSDLQFQIEIEKVLRLEGALGVSRVAGNLMEINMGSVISGANADNPAPYEFTMGGSGVDSSLPVGADGSKIEEGSTVMIDMNGAFNGYQTDMTRVWALGEIPEIATKAHNCSIRILRTLENLALPGVEVCRLYESATSIAEEEGLAAYFMGHKSKVSFIGHGVGIELNELPVVNAKSKILLAENMTIALEPKFVIPGVGAVGVENTYRVTSEVLENLTTFPESIESL